MVSFYKFDKAISFFKLENQQIISAPGIFYFVIINHWLNPLIEFFFTFLLFLLIEFCNGCFADYLEMERLKSFEYTNGTIDIHKIETQDDNSANNSDSEVSNISLFWGFSNTKFLKGFEKIERWS